VSPRLGAVDLSQLAQPGLMYIKLTTPLGDAIVDPFAAAQDSTTQQIMQRLGIGVTVGFGPAPVPAPGTSNLFQNLSLGIPLALGALALWLRPELSTALVVGGGLLLLNSGLLANVLAPAGSS
jgi:hypothetical protein